MTRVTERVRSVYRVRPCKDLQSDPFAIPVVLPPELLPAQPVCFPL